MAKSGTGIDQLNFEIILNDEKFHTAVKRDLDVARALNTELSNVLNLKKRLNNETTEQLVNAEKVKQAELKTAAAAEKVAAAKRKVKTETDNVTAAEKKHKDEVIQTKEYLTSTQKVLRVLSQLTGAAFSVVGIRRFLESLIRITGEFEVQKMALRTILQDVDAADKIFQDLYRFSSDSTYRFSELAKYSKQLAAFNIGKENLLETTKMLGDVASGVGVSMDRLILAYGHVKSSGFLRGIQLRSFSQNGVPILEELSKMMTEVEHKAVSLGDVFDRMTKREIPFEMVEEAFKRMTSEGGKFYKMQEVLSKTLAGQINILKGRWENMLAAIGQAKSGALKGAVTSISNLIANYEKVGRSLTELLAAFGTYKLILFISTAATEGLFAATFKLNLAMEKLWLTIMKNPYAVLAATITLVGYSFYKAYNTLSDTERIQAALTKGTNDYKAALKAENAELEALYAKLKYAKEGTDEYAAAKSAIQNRFGTYIEQLRSEGVAVDNLANIYSNLAKKIEDANKQRFLEQTISDLGKENENAVTKLIKRNQALVGQIKSITGKELTVTEQETLWQYVSGAIDETDEDFKALEKTLNRVAQRSLPRTSGAFKSATPSTNNAPTFRNILDSMRTDYASAATTYANAMADAQNAFENGTKAAGQAAVPLQDWAKKANEAILKLDQDIADSFKPKKDEGYFEYIDRIGKEFKEIHEYRDKALNSEKSKYDKQLDVIRQIDKALEGNILSDVRYTRTPWNGSGGSKNPFADAISDKKTSVANLEKYKDAYEQLFPWIGEEAAKKWVSDNMGYNIEKFEEDVLAIIAALKGMGDEGKEAASVIESRLGLDEASQLKKRAIEAAKAIDDYAKAFAKFDKDWGTGATGVAGKAEKAIRDYNNENKEINDDYVDATMKAALAHLDNSDAIKEETDKLYELYKARKNANTATFKDTINGLADDIFKKAMEGFDLTNWDDKTLGQIKDIEAALDNLDIPEDVKELLKEYPELLADLKSVLDKLANKNLDNTIKPEKLKKIAKYATESAKAVKLFADAMGNTELKEYADGFSDLANMAEKAASAFTKFSGLWNKSNGKGIGKVFGSASEAGAAAGWIAAVVALNMKVLELSAQEKEIEKTQREAFREAMSKGRMQTTEKGSIFGTSDIALMNSRLEQLDKIRKSMDKYGKDMSVTTKHYGFWYKALGWSQNENWSNGKLLPDRVSSISTLAKNLGMQLYDQYGNLNAETLRAILNSYESIKDEERAWIDQAIKDSEDYAEAMKDVEDILESVFGEIASSAADKVIDRWIEAGDAALDYADILDEVARNYAKLLIKSAIIEKVLNKDEADKVANMFVNGDADGAMAAIAYDMQRIADMEPLFAQIMSAFDPYFNREEESKAGSVGKGIQSITEDTASLLASYINAIRADVAGIRAQDAAGWENVAVIGSFVPTLNDYIVLIQADTANIAESNFMMLDRIESMMDDGLNGGRALRVAVQ